MEYLIVLELNKIFNTRMNTSSLVGYDFYGNQCNDEDNIVYYKI